MKPAFTNAINGRGSLSNPEGRFERLGRERFDDGWDIPEEPLPPLQTTVTPDPARSIISRNQSPDIPFRQSINPYRGCEHGCIYCLSGDTPILMADGTTRRLEGLRAGDEIYGTVRQGWYRRYVKTRVLAHWSVIKPAYQVTLEDGTELIASGNHRFLTERGWKFVTGRGTGGQQRPHLTTGNKLMGSGAFACTPDTDRDYRQGYLCGLIRGDGHLASYHYARAGRAHGDQHQFRLALCDGEALQRVRQFLREFAIDTHEFLFQAAVGSRRRMYAIRTHVQAGVERIHSCIAWPDGPSLSWRRGFLAGIFDAEGSYSGGSLRISNTDETILREIATCFERLDFAFSLEYPHKTQGKPISVVRLRGGLREHLRFFHSTDPAIRRRCSIEAQAVKNSAVLRVAGIKSLNGARRLYDITTGTGDFIANGVVSHNCYARPSHAYLNLSPGLDFETRLFYKEHAAERLEEELRKPGYRCEPITLGANTDPYQPIERKLKVTRSILEVLQRFHHPVSIITKSTLITRDLDILTDLAQQNLVSVMVTITTLDDVLKRSLEPRAPSGWARLKVVHALTHNAVPTGVMTAPVIPSINDADMERILTHAANSGACCAGYVLLRLPYAVKDLFREWLTAHFPDRAAHVMSLIRQSHGGKDYEAEFGTRMRGRGAYADLIAHRFALACRRLGLTHGRETHLNTALFRVPGDDPQMDLWAG